MNGGSSGTEMTTAFRKSRRSPIEPFFCLPQAGSETLPTAVKVGDASSQNQLSMPLSPTRGRVATRLWPGSARVGERLVSS